MMQLLPVLAVLALGAGVVWYWRHQSAGTSPDVPAGGVPAPNFGGAHWDRNGMTKRHWQATLDLEKQTTGRNEVTIRAFIQNVTIAGIWHHLLALGYNPVGPLAIMCWETGFGLSHAAREHDALFGISYEDKKHVWWPYVYDSVPHSLEHFHTLMQKELYRLAWAAKQDPLRFLQRLHDAGYNSNETWIAGVTQKARQILEYMGE